MDGNDLGCLIHRFSTKEGKTALHDSLVFLGGTCGAIIGCELGRIDTGVGIMDE
jgi:hypothetical protein